VPTPTPTPTPVPVLPSIQFDAIIQTAHITSLWWQKTTTLEVLVINKGTLATDVTFEYAVLADQNTTIIAQGTQTVFISGLDKKTVYINIPTPPDGTYTIQFRVTQPVTVEATNTVTVETPFYGRPEFTVALIFLIALAIFMKRRR
jgi:CO/xanthine dehydrogenase Mo-binding subunit